jgi:hypothetical protein
MDWIDLALDRDQWRVLMNTVMKLDFSSCYMNTLCIVLLVVRYVVATQIFVETKQSLRPVGQTVMVEDRGGFLQHLIITQLKEHHYNEKKPTSQVHPVPIQCCLHITCSYIVTCVLLQQKLLC